MTEHVFFEENGYFLFCDASESGSKKWTASVLFERKNDMSKTLVPGLRHKLPEQFETAKDAIDAVVRYGCDVARADNTGLD